MNLNQCRGFRLTIDWTLSAKKNTENRLGCTSILRQLWLGS